MKSRTIVVVATFMALSAVARITAQFHTWSEVVEQSSCVIIARCGERTTPAPGTDVVNGPMSDSAIEVIAVLKGTNCAASSRLLTDHDLQKGEKYLIFGNSDNNVCLAFEEFRVIPLGKNFQTNSVAGKPLDDQLHLLFQRRLDNLNRQIKKEMEERRRLEEGVAK